MAAEPPGFDMKAGARMALLGRDVLLPWLVCLAAACGCLEVSAWLLDSAVGQMGPLGSSEPECHAKQAMLYFLRCSS